MVFCMGFRDRMEWTERLIGAKLNKQRNWYIRCGVLNWHISIESLLWVRGLENIYILFLCIDGVFYEWIRPYYISDCSTWMIWSEYASLRYSGTLLLCIILFKTVFSCLEVYCTVLVFSWYSLIMDYPSQDGIFVSWLNIILIKRVFSCLDQDGIFVCDPYWVYRGFSTGSKLNLAFIWSSKVTYGDTLIKSFKSNSRTYNTIEFIPQYPHRCRETEYLYSLTL